MSVPAGSVVLIGISVVVAVMFLVIGYQVRVHRKLNLLAGYDPSSTADPDGLARMAGSLLYVMGVGTLVVPVPILLFPDDVAVALIGVGYVVFLWAGVLTMVIGGRRYLR